MVWILENPVEMAQHLLTAASTDPLSAVLVAIGGLLVTVSAGGFGVLALGALLEALVPDTATERQRRVRQ
ncbi:hypothetical protein [Halobacterium yunchengense]|uniref:hypothetical protein n=1 Tax=Halobacterium yunchengense TaxID=3108497 RepID=UPI00300BBA81